MIKFFRKIRQILLTENKFSKYILYAIGEIALVMIGILLALQVNNSNEQRKSKVQEIEILKGIKQDLVNDTTDISYNVRGYEFYIELDSLILSHFYHKKKFNKLVLDYFTYGVTANWFVELHSSLDDSSGFSKAISTTLSRSASLILFQLYFCLDGFLLSPSYPFFK